ncbi:MAG: carboxypeptidase-like regulatory domain-containing protein [Candidatus Sumerlaeota bacterium]|nr:carboxypeptidase-like regulatory domain-containing protein [Candidatus Sumerlaeota bacterium]
MVFHVVKANALIQGTITHDGQVVDNLDMIFENDNGYIGSTQTNGDGYYYFPVLAGTYYVRPNGDWLVERNIAPVARRQVAVPAGTTVTLDFDLQSPTAWLDVQVLGEGGAPLEGMNIWVNIIIAANQEEGLLGDARTNAQGEFILGVTPGSYHIGVDGNNLANAGYMAVPMQIAQATAGSTQTVIFQAIKANAWIEGTVTHSSQPVAQLNMMLLDNTPNRNYIGSVWTDDSGYYWFPVLAGSYYVQPDPYDVAAKALVPILPCEITVPSGTTGTLNFDLSTPTAWLNIHVLNADETPHEGMLVYVCLFINDTQDEHLITQNTNAAGVIPLGLNAGKYTVGLIGHALDAGYLPEDDMQVILTDGDVLDRTFHIRPLKQATLDTILGRFAPSDFQRSILDANSDGQLNIGDMIWRAIQR